jgi:hypothetical protein
LSVNQGLQAPITVNDATTSPKLLADTDDGRGSKRTLSFQYKNAAES